jgi:hypothetical protein
MNSELALAAACLRDAGTDIAEQARLLIDTGHIAAGMALMRESSSLFVMARDYQELADTYEAPLKLPRKGRG